jgi:acyl transferase domain-containing protein
MVGLCVFVGRGFQVNGGHLPDHIGPFCAAAAAIAAALPVLHLFLKRLQQSERATKTPNAQDLYQPTAILSDVGAGYNNASSSAFQQAAERLWSTWQHRTAVDWVLALLPSGVGFAVGCYLTPNWTVPRVLGSVCEQAWLLLSPDSHAAFMMVTASGLVLGEGCASVVTAVVQAIVK